MSKETILIITDTTDHQVNGVVRTMNKTIELLSSSYNVNVINPSKFKTFHFPFYKEIEIAYNTKSIGSMIEEYNPDYIHICTEGPVGFAAKKYCDKKGYNYTTSYHSMFPEFFKQMYGVPTWLSYNYFKNFHSNSKGVFVPTIAIKELLESKGFNNLRVWSRGVDRKLFKYKKRSLESNTVTVLCVSRVSAEKGLDDFCSLKLPENYEKVLVGDGPYLETLKNKYTDVTYVGKRLGEKLYDSYSSSDVFIFPSKTDTFGLVMLESISSGTPVVAYETNGSKEIIQQGVNGFIVENLIDGIEEALKLDRSKVSNTSKKWTWESCTEVFIENLVKK